MLRRSQLCSALRFFSLCSKKLGLALRATAAQRWAMLLIWGFGAWVLRKGFLSSLLFYLVKQWTKFPIFRPLTRANIAGGISISQSFFALNKDSFFQFSY